MDTHFALTYVPILVSPCDNPIHVRHFWVFGISSVACGTLCFDAIQL